MDSKQKNSVGIIRRILVYFIIAILTVITLNGFGLSLEAYAYDSSKADSKTKISIPVFSELITDVSWVNEYNDKNSDEVNLNVGDNFKEKFVEAFNMKVDAYKISIDDNLYGYVATKEEREYIVQDICNSYIEELGVDPEEIIQIGIISEIEATPFKVNYDDLKESNEIAQEIYSNSLEDKDLLGVRIITKSSEVSEIEPSVVTESTDELYMGESKKVAGKKGKMLLSKELVFDGLTKIKEAIVNEKVLVEPKATVIKQGSKNPYNDGVAFLVRPTRGGYMSSDYGEERYSSYHKGIDIAKNLGDDVNAAFDGKIISAGYNDGGYGNLIIIEHENDMTTYYAHLNDIYVKEGEIIKKGQRVGSVGNTGLSTGPHLHFELRVNGEPVNPTNYILGL